MPDYSIDTAGDNSIFINLANEISPQINQLVVNLSDNLSKSKLSGIIEWVPSYTGIMIFFNPLNIRHSTLKEELYTILNNLVFQQFSEEKSVTKIPVCYESVFGPDINYVCKTNGLSHDELINIHTQNQYLVYMLGFTPGFPYLGGMDKRLSTARKSNPETSIDAGSVGIAGAQTGIYPVKSPGGWQIIGRTPVRLFDPNRRIPFLIKQGQYIEFYSVDHDQYMIIEDKVKNHSYHPETETV